MTTRRQIEANRANAKKSTGPKTEAGKERARANAMKHGLTAEVLVTRSEDAEDFDKFRDALMEENDPQTAMECQLVERIAGISWRLRRVQVLETGVIDFREEQALEREREKQERECQPRNHLRDVLATVRREEVEEEESEPGEEEEEPDLLEQSITLGDALTNDFGYTNSLPKLVRYEMSLTTMLKKTYEMLHEFQRSRKKKEKEEQQEEEAPRRLSAA